MKKKIITAIIITLLTLPIILGIILITITNPAFIIDDWEKMNTSILSSYITPYTVYDSQNNVYTKVSEKCQQIASYEDIPQHTIDAFISAEDKRFYKHDGVDYYRIMGALFSNLTHFSFKEGASTISQQLIKNTHLSADKTIERKLKEIRIAKEVEQNYNKEDILTMYLNALYFGNSTFGISSATNFYFNKDVSELSISESAVLASIINNPSLYDPISNKENNLKRRNLILSRMCELDYISLEQANSAKKDDINILKKQVFSQIHYYIQPSKDMSNIITSNINSSIQNTIENAITKHNVEDILINVLVIDVNDSTLVSAASNTPINLSNTLRQPGSTLKPIISYAPAFESNLITPLTKINDEKTNFNGYIPSNYKNKYYGMETAENCLSKSLNIPAVKLLEMNGIRKATTFARKLGIKLSKDDKGLAIALGGLKNGLTLKELADAYSTFASGGFYKSSSVTTEKSALSNKKIKVIHEDSAYFINRMLNTCAKSGTAKRLSTHNISAKTGTVSYDNGNSDAYCIAYNKNYVVATWAGATTGSMDNSITGGGLPADICKSIFDDSQLKSDSFSVPNSIVTLDIDSNEYHNNNKFILASTTTPAKDKFKAQFSIRNLPQKSQNSSNNDYLYGNNFKIVDDFS